MSAHEWNMDRPLRRFSDRGQDGARHERERAVAREHSGPSPLRSFAVKKSAAEWLLTVAWWLVVAAMAVAAEGTRRAIFARQTELGTDLILAALALYAASALAALGALLWHFYGRSK